MESESINPDEYERFMATMQSASHKTRWGSIARLHLLTVSSISDKNNICTGKIPSNAVAMLQINPSNAVPIEKNRIEKIVTPPSRGGVTKDIASQSLATNHQKWCMA